MIIKFIDDIKEYLAEETELEVSDAYTSTDTPKPDTIKVQLYGFTPRDQDLQNVASYSVPIQVFVYATKSSTQSAITKSYDLINQIVQLFDKNKIKNNNSNVIKVGNINVSPALPVKEGSQLYVASIRVEFTVNNPYTKIYEGE